MRRDFRFQQGYRLTAARFAQIVQRKPGPLSGMHWRTPLQVRQRKVRFTIPTISGAEQRKQRRILAERQQLSVTPSPAFRCKVEGKDSDFSDKWISHVNLLKLKQNCIS